MYKIYLYGISKTHEYEELIKLFLRPDEYIILTGEETLNTSTKEKDSSKSEKKENIKNEESVDLCFHGNENKNVLKKEIYKKLHALTGKTLPWGILTGIRPVKLAGEFLEQVKDPDEVIRILEEKFCASPARSRLALDMYNYQIESLGKPEANSIGVYIGIPFCPSRCNYCSFTSNQVEPKEWQRYLVALHMEIDFLSKLISKNGLTVESLYVGGGTPTTLGAESLDLLLNHINKSLVDKTTKEITVEAGRADTINPEKLKVIKGAGVDRISINPQSMKNETLVRIGREHTREQVLKAFEMAYVAGIQTINTDLIAGLQGENPEDFKYSLEEVIKLDPANITIHSIAVKRASRLGMSDKEYHYNKSVLVEEMLKEAKNTMANSGYKPYYLYRQKQMSGAMENIGYCKAGTEGIYNVRIMDEHQSILALGAGGVSKIYYPEENRLERVPNVNNYQIYIDKIQEMMERKRVYF